MCRGQQTKISSNLNDEGQNFLLSEIFNKILIIL